MFEALQEAVRESVTGDDKFFRDLVYYFELQVPAHKTLSDQKVFLFPLILGPENIELSEPFAITQTEGQGAGLVVEENGIIGRSLRLRGHTGWKPRPMRPGASNFGDILAPSTGRSFSRSLLHPIQAVSGQRHFQFLQDAVFRTYADFKKDPSTSEGTKLLFHHPKDSEHWEVKPKQFSLSRSLERRNLYQYDIDLLIVGVADDPAKTFSEDKSLLDTIKDAARMVQSFIDAATAALQDLAEFVNDIARTIKGIIGIVNSVSGLISAATDFVKGVEKVIRSPFEAITSVHANLDFALAQMSSAVRAFPDQVFNDLRQLKDAVAKLGSFPQLFQTDTQRTLEAIRRGEELSTSRSQQTLVSAALQSPPNSFQKLIDLGTGLMPGDLNRAKSELKINKELANYQSASERELGSGDTLQSLAAKFMGDARLYRHIAVLNGLTYPFISKEGIPGTKRIGDKILIPSTDPAPEAQIFTAVLGVSPAASTEERIMGTDLSMSRVRGPGDFFDWDVDTEGGSVDVKTVTGIPNLIQALTARLRTERGTDQLYSAVGVDRVVGLGIPALGPQIVGIKVSQAVRSDPRVSDVRNLEITVPSPDSVVLEMDVEVLGIAGSHPINLTF